MEACQTDLKCNFYKVGFVVLCDWDIAQHYPVLDGRPEQCFFFDTCGKLVRVGNSHLYWETRRLVIQIKLLQVFHMAGITVYDK